MRKIGIIIIKKKVKLNYKDKKAEKITENPHVRRILLKKNRKLIQNKK